MADPGRKRTYQNALCRAASARLVHCAARLLSRGGMCLALMAATIAVSDMMPSRAQAQTMIGSNQSIGPVPDYAGTGLYGLYSITSGNAAFTGDTSPLASFLTTNICFPDCSAGAFSDGAGGLMGFTNGNATNITFFNPDAPVPQTWNNSSLSINGYIAITQPGTYSFTLSHDDDISLSLGGQNIVDLGCCGVSGPYGVNFASPGLYAIAINFIENGGGSYEDLLATDPTGTCILGCYDRNGALQPNSLFYSDGQLQGAPAPIPGSGPLSLILALGTLAAMKWRNRRVI